MVIVLGSVVFSAEMRINGNSKYRPHRALQYLPQRVGFVENILKVF